MLATFQLIPYVFCWINVICVLFVSFLEEEEIAGCFAFIVLRMSRYSKCSVTLLHGAMGWSALCDWGIP